MYTLAAHMLPLSPGASRKERVERSEAMLLHALSKGTMVAVVGSGCSIAFGYPDWTHFAGGVIEETLGVLQGQQDRGASHECVEGFKAAIARAQDLHQDLQNDVLMYFIGACQQHLRHLDDTAGRTRYQDYIKRTFRPCGHFTTANHDPYEALLELPIKRFVTTNYDCEIEKALARERNVPERDLGLDQTGLADETRRRLSLTQKDHAELARFPVADLSDNENMVFHCHGRYDDVDTIIASEDDYQRWYLTDHRGLGPPFRESFELLLTHNPLLFVGYSMRDEDLMRNLRRMGALDPAQKNFKPLFALVEDREENRYYHEALFERYGVNVIPYPAPSCRDASPAERTAELCRKLTALREGLEETHRLRFRKPWVRKPRVKECKPESHIELPAYAEVPGGSYHELAAAAARPGLVDLIGPSGAGKSMALGRLFKNLRQTHPDFEGSFYWSAHYGYEFLTAADHALCYFDPCCELTGSRYERISLCLVEHRYLLVLDGCERLLRPDNPPTSGRSYSTSFRRLLRSFASPANQSTVVLASRLALGDLDAIPEVRRTRTHVPLEPLNVDDLAESQPLHRCFTDPDGGSLAVSALCSLLQGHSYGLQLASTFLADGPADCLSKLKQLNTNLATRPIDQRLHGMLEILLGTLDGGRAQGPHAALLEGLSLFLSPLCEQTIGACRAQDSSAADAHALADRLRCHGLLIRSKTDEFSAVHATVRKELLHPQLETAADAIPAFGISSYTSGRFAVGPGIGRSDLVKNIFAKLMKATRLGSINTHEKRNLCRDAFGLLRTCMDANTATRWIRLDEYARFGLQVILLAGEISGDGWDYCEYRDARLIERSDGALYLGELAWLYTDLGLAFSSEGSLEEANRLFEQAYEISRVIEGKDGGGYQIETLFNLVLLFIEKGRLPAARRYLIETARLAAQLDDDDYSARIRGFRALLSHLCSDLQKASRLYAECLETLGPGTNLRAKSFFSRCHADLKMDLQECDEASLLALTGRAVAEAGAFPDLVAYSRFCGGRVLAMKNELAEARREYEAVLREADQLGLRKLQSEVLGALSQLALKQGDREGAHVLAMRSLGLANQLGYCLQTTRSLVLIGRVTVAIEQQDMGLAYLRLAQKLAHEQEYWYCKGEAERELQRLGERLTPGGLDHAAETNEWERR